MKKKFKVTLIVFLVVILGCFSETFAATKVGTKLKKNVQFSMNKNLLDSATTNDAGEIDQYTKLLMHMEDNTFKDEYGHAISNNNVQFDATNKKIGNGSASFNGSSSYFKTVNDDYLLNNKDFTVDCWIYVNSVGSFGGHIFEIGNNSKTNCLISCYQDKTIRFLLRNTSTGENIFNMFSSSVISYNTWYHIEGAVQGNNAYLFINGKLEKSTHFSKRNDGGNIVIIGRQGPAPVGTDTYRYFNGCVDELKLSIGIARHTEDFPLPVIGNRATLTINMVNGSVKQYDLSASELDSFLNWYNGMTNPLSSQCYIFNVPALGPYVTNKDYIPFNKIDDFKIQEYIKQ